MEVLLDAALECAQAGAAVVMAAVDLPRNIRLKARAEEC